jgi:folate-binding protein YgfZ
MTESPYFTTLQNRGQIRISGTDRRTFLQALVSNDIYALDRQPCVYACLLNAQGKFVHDFFMTEKNGTVFLECEGGARAEELARRFILYKLRAKIEISCEKIIPVYAVFGKSMGVPDPRHPDMGYRSLEKPEGMEEKPFEAWDRHRILLTIPDGSRDMIPEKSTLEESNIDKLNGVSYEKGCYVGQELTARMHYRGLAKKHLYTIKGTLPAPGEEIKIDNELVGEMRSRCGDVGLALLKDEHAKKLNGIIGF